MPDSSQVKEVEQKKQSNYERYCAWYEGDQKSREELRQADRALNDTDILEKALRGEGLYLFNSRRPLYVERIDWLNIVSVSDVAKGKNLLDYIGSANHIRLTTHGNQTLYLETREEDEKWYP